MGGNGKGLAHWQAWQEMTVPDAHELLYMMHDNVWELRQQIL